MMCCFPPTEDAFHKEVGEFKKRSLEQEKEKGVDSLTVASLPSHDPDQPLGERERERDDFLCFSM